MPNVETPYILNKKNDDVAEMLLYDLIGESWWEDGLTAKKVANDLKDLGDVKLLNVHINSQGGSVFHGIAIYNALRRFSNEERQVHTYIDGAAFSIASVIAMAGNRVMMADNAMLMIHDPWTFAQGSASELRRYADLLDKSKEQILRAYLAKTGGDRTEISDLMENETYLDADEAIELGFVDDVYGEVAIAALSQPYGSQHVPSHLRDKYDSFFAKSRKEDPMPTAKDQNADSGTPTPVAATVQQLKALPGSDAEWVLAQLEAGATLADAQSSLMQKLYEDNQRILAERDAAIESAQRSDKSPPVVRVLPTHDETDDESFGSDPVKSQSGGQPNRSKSTVDAHAEYRRIMRAYMESGLTAVEASLKFSKENKELAEELGPWPGTLDRRSG